MIILPIRSRHSLITTYVQLYHDRTRADAYVALDTGATSSLITPSLVRQLGLHAATAPFPITSATGVEMVRGYRLGCIQLGSEKVTNLQITAVALPARLQLV